MSTIASGPNSLRIWEVLLGLLKEGGVDDLRAAWGIDLLTLYVTAIAAEQSVRRGSDQGLGRVKNALSTVSEKNFPLVFASKETLLSGGGETRGEWALEAPEGGVSRQQLYEIFTDGWDVESVELVRGEVSPAFTAEFPDAFPEGGPKGWFAIIRRKE